MFAWYWLAVLCEREPIPFVLGHAPAMKAIHGGKAKNDRLDAQKIAGLLKVGFFQVAHVYPKAKRETCSDDARFSCVASVLYVIWEVTDDAVVVERCGGLASSVALRRCREMLDVLFPGGEQPG